MRTGEWFTSTKTCVCVCVYCMHQALHICKHKHVGCVDTHNTPAAFVFLLSCQMLRALTKKKINASFGHLL